GARYGMACWKDSDGNFWFHGGSSVEYLGDTWRFDGTFWAFWGGSTEINAQPNYGSQKEFSVDYHPGGRYLSTVATSGSSVYLIGGWGKYGYNGDIWKFESDKGWAYWSGDINQTEPIPGTMKVPHETNKMGSRYATTPVVDD